MMNFDTQLKDLLENIDEEYGLVNKLAQTHRSLVNQQEEIIIDTVLKLLPIMKSIKKNHYYFRGKDSEINCSKGPVFFHDKINGKLYAYDVEQENPMLINLYNENDFKIISFRDLLDTVSFTQIMESLVILLDYHEELQKRYQDAIDKLESEIKDYKYLI